ncbi:putative CD27 antigen, partial [Triplophysa rosa]
TCQLCLPRAVEISAFKSSSSNLKKHIEIQRGSTHSHLLPLLSRLIHIFTMLTLLSIFLPLSHVLSLGQSLNCNERIEYKEGNRCCKKCPPGELMAQRCSGQSDTKCVPCSNGYYNDDYNNDFLQCKLCKGCYKEHMKVERNCTLTRDAVCTCEDGFRCSDSSCETCVKVQTPVTTKPPATTDNMWISVSLCFACVCVCALLTCFLLISRHGWPCKRIMSASAAFCSSEKRGSKCSECTEEEEVPMPVQEVCEKTLEDV